MVNLLVDKIEDKKELLNVFVLLNLEEKIVHIKMFITLQMLALPFANNSLPSFLRSVF